MAAVINKTKVKGPAGVEHKQRTKVDSKIFFVYKIASLELVFVSFERQHVKSSCMIKTMFITAYLTLIHGNVI